MLSDLLAVDEQAEAIVGADAHFIAAADLRQKLSGPTHAETIGRQRLIARPLATRDEIVSRRATVPTECDALIDASHDGSTAEIFVAEVLALQALFFRVGC